MPWARRCPEAGTTAGTVMRPKKPATPKTALPVPAELTAALKKNKKAQTAFDAFAPSHRREYIEWITEAKTDATWGRRLF